jgi:hypothetical protein
VKRDIELILAANGVNLENWKVRISSSGRIDGPPAGAGCFGCRD